ncbi:hypothetical protein HanXRQr2_Chr05g0216721 [Helianthus annuus]|uniref:Uncharacterized protein n=1 Tax=Helianthus annuus TaxID=4232 RepID=A0A9K3J064_HELAN|nr:hypothetical protein HanXRQr2_Chr05g0216721 [Helianthus annuus]KAJ0922903.1 hypothetical protein HanPSC8_Chr05g0209351 [Helianthus annuus]
MFKSLYFSIIHERSFFILRYELSKKRENIPVLTHYSLCIYLPILAAPFPLLRIEL